MDLGRDPLCLLNLLLEPVHLDGPFARGRLDLAGGARQLVGRDAHGRCEDRLGDAERGGEDDAFAGSALEGEVLGESSDILDVRSSEAVDRLVRIGSRSEVSVAGDKSLEEHRLCVRDVLVLVDEEMTVLIRDRLGDGRVQEEACCLCEQGSVVDERTLAQRPVVAIEKAGEPSPVRTIVRHVFEVGRADELLAAPEDEVGYFVGERAGCEQESERR